MDRPTTAKHPDRCPRCGGTDTRLVPMPIGHTHAGRLECATPKCGRRFIRWVDGPRPTPPAEPTLFT